MSVLAPHLGFVEDSSHKLVKKIVLFLYFKNMKYYSAKENSKAADEHVLVPISQ